MSRRERLGRLLDAGAAVLSRRGYHGTTMRDVARESGVGLATIYHYVGSKEELLYLSQQRILEAAVASAQAASAVRGSRERLKALITDHIRRVLHRPAEAAVLAGRLGALTGDRGRRIEALRQRYLALVEATVEAALRRPVTRGRDARLRTRMLLGMADRLALDDANREPPPRPGTLAAKVLAVFLDGARKR